MKRIFIIHGWDGSPNEPMHKWLKENLKKEGFEVEVPEMPNPEEPEIEVWNKKIIEVVQTPTKDTFFIGHSVGCQSVLRYLQQLDESIKVGGAVFIAPWMHLDKKTIEEEGEEVIEIAKPWMEIPIDWEKVKQHTTNFICLLSDNDPYVPLSNKELFEENLSAKIIIEHNKGHYAPMNNIIENKTALHEIITMVKHLQ